MLHSLKPTPASFSLLRRLRSTSTSAAAAATGEVPLAPLVPADPNLSALAGAFKDWFLRRDAPPSPIDRIYSALSSSPDDDSAASLLRLPLSESLVLAALRHPSPDDLLLRLKFFDWSSRHPSFRHTRATYHAVFSLLSRHRLSSVILDWLHAAQTNPSFPARRHDTLVLGYAVAGRPDLALSHFAKMRFQGLHLDRVSFHVLLNSLVEADLHDYAATLLAHPTAPDDTVTACIKLKSLCRQGRVHHAEAYFRELIGTTTGPDRRGLCDHGLNTIVNALCAQRKFNMAGQLVEEFGTGSAFGVWLNHLVRARKLDTALHFLRSKKEHGVENVPYSAIVSQLVFKNRLEEAYDMLVEMMEEGIAPETDTMNVALCFFCKAGMVEVAVQLYRSRSELGMSPTSWVYEHLISALCRDSKIDEAWAVLEESVQQGFFPGKQTFGILASLLCREGKLGHMYKLLEEAVHRKIQPTTAVLARYLSALCKTGKVKEAFMVPHMVPGGAQMGKYKYTYTSLIHACLMMEQGDMLPALLIEMQEHGHSPSQSLFRKVICFLCEKGKNDAVFDLLTHQLELKKMDPHNCFNFFIEGAAFSKKHDMAKKLYTRMLTAGLVPTVATDLIMLNGYLKSSRIGDALSFFRYLLEKREPSTKLYNVFISGLLEADRPEHAAEIWREARNKNLIPSLQCYEELVLKLCFIQDYWKVVEVLNDFTKTGRPISSFLCNVLLLHSLKSVNLWHAWTQSDDFRAGVSSNAFGGLIEFFTHIRAKENLEYLDEKIEEFYPVDTYTYNMLLRSLTMAGKIDAACDLLRRMHKKGYEPNLYSFDIIVHGFCKLGRTQDAERWMEIMHWHGFSPTGYTKRLYNGTT